MNAAQLSHATVRRLIAAEGYLELGLPAYALRELEAVEDAGPLEPHALYLRGRTFIAQDRFREAIEPLKRAAPRLPAPHNRVAWLSLGHCYRRNGDDTLAEVAEALARTPPPAPAATALVELTIVIDQGRGDPLYDAGELEPESG